MVEVPAGDEGQSTALLSRLAAGTLRSLGPSAAVQRDVLADLSLFPTLMRGLDSENRVLRMRCADIAEKVTADYPSLLLPYKRRLIDVWAQSKQKEIRWHVAPMLLRLPLDEADARIILDTLLDYTRDDSSIVKALAMQALADLAFRFPLWLPTIQAHIEYLLPNGTPAMRARGRQLQKRFKAYANR